MRKAIITRETKETNINLEINIDGQGQCQIETGIAFFDHMLNLFAKHSNFDLFLKAKGDTQIDDHHTVEDIGLCLGLAFKEALGNKLGIHRYASIDLPMDEALVKACIDISGRPFLNYQIEVERTQIKEFEVELIKEFMQAFVNKAEITLHFYKFSGETTHHILEAVFKAFAYVLKEASKIDETRKNSLPSSKGLI